ncbi:DUF6924 domain-containing protein [Streptomyces viridiviolaceus]
MRRCATARDLLGSAPPSLPEQTGATGDGRTFRVPARWCPDVSAGPSTAGMDFTGFADAAD